MKSMTTEPLDARASTGQRAPMKSHTFLVFLLGLAVLTRRADEPKPVFRIGVVGLVHDHARGLLAGLADRRDVELVGIAESNPVLVARYAALSKLPATLF